MSTVFPGLIEHKAALVELVVTDREDIRSPKVPRLNT
jgi:hypothetical protein